MLEKKVLLTILDGWGKTEENTKFNAIEVGSTPIWHRIIEENIKSTLITFGLDVGLPEGQMGNSEVGHMNIGAGRIVYQDLPKITLAIQNKTFDSNPNLLETLMIAKEKKSSVHIMGLFSTGGVHSHLDHYLYTAEFFAKHNIPVILHIFTDGRDTPPQSAINNLDPVENLLSKYSNIKLATISGRYYSMDRDNRWERTQEAYDAIVLGQSLHKSNSFKETLEENYKNNINDEFLKPTVIGSYNGINDNDVLCMINFRNDRVRQILNALLIANFNEFNRAKVIKFSNALGMVEYSNILNNHMKALFPPKDLKNTLGECIAKAGLHQLRIAETEKYPHVTFFFNAGQETPFDKEERILVPSPKVATYDLKPEMSAPEITKSLVESINKNKYALIVANYANGDMVGHTGVLAAAAKATEAVDNALGEIYKAVIKNNYIWLIIADHGNCETMWDFTNNVPHTQHTTNLVYAVLVNSDVEYLKNGKLGDIAPTILKLLGLKQPNDMDGIALF
jgi:2,3-bisphosphoglycerate-independent phosphoglycerate mutase